MSDLVIKQITGKAYWTKVLGRPVPNYNKDGNEWTLDVALDKATVKELKDLGLGPKIKDNKEYSPYITFKRAAVKKAGPRAGEANKPIPVFSPDGKTLWDRDTPIGNGSTVRVKFNLNEVTGGPAKKKFIRADILALQVYEHVPAPEKEPRQEFDANPEAPVPAAVGDHNW